VCASAAWSFAISGVTVPIRAGFDRFAAFTFAADRHAPDFQQRLQRGKDVLQLIGLYFHTHLEAALKPSAFSNQPSELSQREAQCLAWAARGRTMDQTGQILEIKPRTVAFHLDNARNKLEAENVTHTVALALKRGLIP
jgi:LuxR family transcriptional activator of conjugal transfer of Ti plasmids